ncbi:MAG: phosphoribosylformylglycinamidine synthase [Spirochaetes bacterium]|nr:MAG: phosphoribosylformylglycinamidine synthase [Spirochaetota bacterium]
MDTASFRIEVFYKIEDTRSRTLLGKLKRLGFPVDGVSITENYLVNAPLDDSRIELVAGALASPVTQDYRVNEPYVPARFTFAVEIGFLPGVTDNVSHTVREIIEDMFRTHLDPETAVFTSTTFFLDGALGPADAQRAGLELSNPLIQRMKVLTREEYIGAGGMGRELPVVHIRERAQADTVSLDLPDEELLKLGKEGIPDTDGGRRGPLALDMLSLNAIRNYFTKIEKRDPTDVELESIAQTWSEHCKHTIFAAKLDELDEGIFRRYIREATIRIRREKGADDFCVSVFEDNAGGIDFDENYVIADKVETHNSPSALDPFGGAITGIVGVNRDAIGFGMASKPVANRYGFCFADPFDESPLFREKNPESRLLPPRRIMEGVINGVNVGGNCSGIPTPQGFVYFDDRYKGKPLVFVGTIGLIPKTVNGRASTVKKAMPGDRIVMVGGRVGRDGIHGATFSSEALSSGSPATAVQIGDPITQKKLSDAIVKEARDRGLYTSITDNGAGGLSCSVAEMAKESGGFRVDLEKVPLKYPGLSPWQIWVSESQERMTLSVPAGTCGEFIALMEKRGVEATVIGEFTAGPRGIVSHNGKTVFDLDMDFLHNGLPKKNLSTSAPARPQGTAPLPEPPDYARLFVEMTGTLNTAGFEFISTQYDHEVQAGSVIKPLQGKGRVNGSATVVRPVLDSMKGVVLSQGLYPSYSELDPYLMAACSIDTAIRNAVAAGGTLERMALLDNFCWCDSDNPARLSQLKDAARACYDYAIAYGAPFISGKDSMYNDFKGYDEKFAPVKISVPPTLLISSFGVVPDVRACQTMDFKIAGDALYVLGVTRDETAGSEYAMLAGRRAGGTLFRGTVPGVDAASFAALYRAYTAVLRAGLIASGISLERGGFGVALARSAMAGMLGARVELTRLPAEGSPRADTLLYAESQGRMLVSVDPARAAEFETAMTGFPCARIGEVTEAPVIEIGQAGRALARVAIEECLSSYRGRFGNF